MLTQLASAENPNATPSFHCTKFCKNIAVTLIHCLVCTVLILGMDMHDFILILLIYYVIKI